MGFLDALGDAAKTLGKAAIAGPGVLYDVATAVAPGDQWGDADNGGFGSLMNNLGGRFGDLVQPVPAPVRDAFGSAMHGATWLYHEGVDQPLSTTYMMIQHTGATNNVFTADYGDLFNGSSWAEAYRIAEHQSVGESIMTDAAPGMPEGWAGDTRDPLKVGIRRETVIGPDGRPVEKVITPFDEADFTKAHPGWAQSLAFGADLTVSWFLDPFVVAGKGVGAVRQTTKMGKIPEAAKPNFGSILDGSAEAVHSSGISKLLEPDWSGRLGNYFSYINGENKLGRPLNAAEIRAITPELRISPAGRAISSALEDALKIEDVAQRENAARRIFAVGAGDTSQIARLETEVAGTAHIADKLRNIVREKTVDLTDQALMREVQFDPAFRAAFNKQIENLDEAGDVTKFVKGWHAQVKAKLDGDSLLLTEAAGKLDNLPGVHRSPLGGTAAHLRKTQGQTVLQKTEKAHDAAVDRLTRFPGRESYSSVYQRGLHSMPLLVAYPARLTANLLPTKVIPAVVRNLQQTHLTGFVETHDWDSGVTQLDSMMRVAGVDDTTRIGELSAAMKARTEMDRLRAVERAEHVAMAGLARSASERHGISIDSEFIREAMLAGQSGRNKAIGAMSGGRLYATTKQSEEMALRSRGMMAAKQAARKDDALASEAERRGAVLDELGDFKPRMDQIIDESGVPLSLPIVSSQLANRVPLFDVQMAKQLVHDKAWVERMAAHSEAWKDEALELKGLQRQLAQATGDTLTRLQRAITQKRQMMDAVLHAASVSNRWWKMSVLFRLGYPMRVIADDHMRIAARLGYMPFLAANLPEATANTFYNYMPGVIAKSSRRGEARKAFALAQADRQRLVAELGYKTPPSDLEWRELKQLHKTYLSGVHSAEEKAAAHARILELDPLGRTLEWADLQNQVGRAHRSIAQHKRNIEKWTEAGETEKVAKAQAAIREREGEIAIVTEQLAGRTNPDELRKALSLANDTLKLGPKGFRADKRHIGEREVTLDDGSKVAGAFDSPAGAYRSVTSSNHAFNYQMTDGEQTGFALLSSGHWRSVEPGEPGYYQLWANILNHQFQHSPEFMAVVKGGVKTPDEFAAWLKDPDNKHLIERMEHYAHDPQDWGGRLIAITEDYIPSSELQELVAGGRVSARQLQKLFPDGDPRLPNLHGQLADVQSGRNTVTRAFSQSVGNAFRYLSELPTDRLSRHPYFNAIYRREVKAAARVRIAGKGDGATFSQKDLHEIESIGRQKALAELRRTLWDVSAHSSAAHTMRFLSPFFAAHQEALTRWWHLAQDDPSVVRRFQLFFDAPRKAGLTYNDDGGEVLPGDGIGPGNHIMLKLPFADENGAVNKWLKKMGGGNYWNINENGLNLILQNGLANPGAGPLVTVPLEVLAQKYADHGEIEKAARIINPYPPAGDSSLDIALGSVQPAWTKRVLAHFQGEGNKEFGRTYMQNFADSLVAFRLQNEREPNEAELNALQDKANKETHRDLLLMALSNVGFITPAKPNSRYAAVQNGLQRLYEQMRSEGHDMDWLRENFSKQYGEAYMAMVYSMGTDPAGLDSNRAEVSAIKKYSGLLKDLDPSLTRMVIGPEVETAEDAERIYSSAAASWLRATDTGSGETYLGRKNPKEVAAAQVINAGWRQYEELTNYLDVLADQQGLDGYEQSPQLVEAKKAGLQYIRDHNEVFAFAYDQWSRESFDKKVADMRQIVSNKRLLNDPTRSDIYWLSQYIAVRDTMTQELRRRAAAGGAKTMEAKANADLAKAFQAAVSYMNSQSTYFKQYMYEGSIERDPYLLGLEAD